MSESPKREEFYVIVKGAVDSIGESTAYQRQEIYEFARNYIAEFFSDNGSSDSSRYIKSFEAVAERVEIDHIARRSQMIWQHSPSPLPPDLGIDSGYAAEPQFDVVHDAEPRERTARFLRNMGAG